MARTIELVTELPGPKSREVLRRKEQVIVDAKSIYLPIVIDRAHGIVVHDIDGNTFLDWTGGIGCLNVGHTNEAVSAALHAQVDRFLHTDFTMVPYESYVELAERLLAVTPISGPKKAAFFNSGAEAVENAVKLAKLATGRSAVITFERAFHGRTLMAMSLTSKQHPYKAGMGPFAPEVYRAPYPYAYRGDAMDVTEAALDELREMFTTHVAPENVAAIIFEPVQGESGFIVPSQEFVEGVREICDANGIVMVADEVQTGFCRTGKVFAMEHFGVEPDLMTIAKSIAAGIPLSGVVGRAHIMDAPGDSAVGGTYVGNPVAIAAAHAVLDAIAEDRLAERATEVGEVIRSRMESWRDRFDSVAEVRGLGAMLAIELRQHGEPAADLATAVADAAARRGLLILKAGINGNCIRVLVPLVIGDAELDEALGAWEEALEEVSA